MHTDYYYIDLETGRKFPSTRCALAGHARAGRVLFEKRAHVGIVTHRDIVLIGRWCIDQIMSEWTCTQTGRVGIQLDAEAHGDIGLIDRWVEDPASVSAAPILGMPEREVCSITGTRLQARIRNLLIGIGTMKPEKAQIAAGQLVDSYQIAVRQLIDNLVYLPEEQDSYGDLSTWFLSHIRSGS